MSGNVAVFMVGGGQPTSLYNGGSISYQTVAGAASASYNFNTDGTVTDTGVTSGGGVAGNNRWFTPATPGIGSGYWIRATLSSGNAWTTGTMGTWIALSSNRTWTLNVGGGAVKSNITLFEIASDAGGATIVATGSVTTQADGT